MATHRQKPDLSKPAAFELDVVKPAFDLLLDGALRLRQGEKGHRAGTDAILLAAAAPALERGLIVDVGAGAGTVGLAVALANPGAEVVLLENHAATADLARENIAENRLDGRVRRLEADLFDKAARKAAGLIEAADLVLTNPPFLRSDETRSSPDAARRAAHVLGARDLADWLTAALALLRPGGVFVAIHRADATGELLAGLGSKLGGLALLPVHPRADAPATRLLLRGVKGAKAPLKILPGLVLHEADGRFTPRAEAIHRGRILRLWPGDEP